MHQNLLGVEETLKKKNHCRKKNPTKTDSANLGWSGRQAYNSANLGWSGRQAYNSSTSFSGFSDARMWASISVLSGCDSLQKAHGIMKGQCLCQLHRFPKNNLLPIKRTGVEGWAPPHRSSFLWVRNLGNKGQRGPAQLAP